MTSIEFTVEILLRPVENSAHFTSYGELGMNHLIEPKDPLRILKKGVTISWLTYSPILTEPRKRSKI